MCVRYAPDRCVRSKNRDFCALAAGLLADDYELDEEASRTSDVAQLIDALRLDADETPDDAAAN